MSLFCIFFLNFALSLSITKPLTNLTLTLTESTSIDATQIFEGSVLAFSFNASTTFSGPVLIQTEVAQFETIELKDEGGNMRLGAVVRVRNKLIFSQFNTSDFQLWEIEGNSLKSLNLIKKAGETIQGAGFLRENDTLYAVYWTRKGSSTHHIYSVDTNTEQHLESPPDLTIEHFSTIAVTIHNSEIFIAARDLAESQFMTSFFLYKYEITSRSFTLQHKYEASQSKDRFQIKEAKYQDYLVTAIGSELGLIRGHFPLLADFMLYQSDRIHNSDDQPQSLLISDYSYTIATLGQKGMVVYPEGSTQELDFLPWSRFTSIPVSIAVFKQLVFLVVETERKVWVVIYRLGGHYMHSVPLFLLADGLTLKCFQLIWEQSECSQNCILLVLGEAKVRRFGVRVTDMEIQVTGLAEGYTIGLCARELFWPENALCTKATIDTMQFGDANIYKGKGYAVERVNSSELVFDVLMNSKRIEFNLVLENHFSGSNLHYGLEIDQSYPGLTVQDTSQQGDLLLKSSKILGVTNHIDCHAKKKENMVYVTLGNHEVRVFDMVETVHQVDFEPLLCAVSEDGVVYLYYEDGEAGFLTVINVIPLFIQYPTAHICKQLILRKFLWCISPLRYSTYDLTLLTILEIHNNDTIIDIASNSSSLVILHPAGVLEMYSNAFPSTTLQYQVNETIVKISLISDYLVGISSSGDCFLYCISRTINLSNLYHFNHVCNDIRNGGSVVIIICGNTLQIITLDSSIHQSYLRSVLVKNELMLVSDVSDFRKFLLISVECEASFCSENTWKLPEYTILRLDIILTNPEFDDSHGIDLKGNLTVFNDQGGRHTATLTIRLLNTGFFPLVNHSFACFDQTVPWTQSFSLDISQYMEGSNLTYSIGSNKTDFSRFLYVTQPSKTTTLPWSYGLGTLRDIDVALDLHLAVLLRLSSLDFEKYTCDEDWNCAQSLECTIDLWKLGIQLPHNLAIIDYSDSHLLVGVQGKCCGLYDTYPTLDTFMVFSYSLAEKNISNWVTSPKITLPRFAGSRFVAIKSEPGRYHLFQSLDRYRELKHFLVQWDGQADIVIYAPTYDLDYVLFANTFAVHKENNSTKVYIAHSYKGILQFQIQKQKLVLERIVPYLHLNLNEEIKSMAATSKYLLLITRNSLLIYSFAEMKYVNKIPVNYLIEEVETPSCVHCEGAESYIVLRGYDGSRFFRVLDGVPKFQVLELEIRNFRFLTDHSILAYEKTSKPFQHIELVHPTLHFPKRDNETESEEVAFSVLGSNSGGSVETCSFLLLRVADNGTVYYLTCAGVLLTLVLSVTWVLWMWLKKTDRKRMVSEENIEMSRTSTDN